MTKYSRLAQVEEKRNIKKAYLYLVLSILAVVFLIVFGLPLLIRFAGFVGRIGKPDATIVVEDTTPPAPPQIENIPEYSNSEKIDIRGNSESGAIIIVRANNKEEELVADVDGNFSFIFSLRKDENTIDFKAKDGSGNISNQTETFKVTYDNTEPEIEIDTPSDGANFYGSKERQITIKGSVSESSTISINGRNVTPKDDLTFSFSTTLNEGENKFEIKAVDNASNETSTTLTFTFTP